MVPSCPLLCPTRVVPIRWSPLAVSQVTSGQPDSSFLESLHRSSAARFCASFVPAGVAFAACVLLHSHESQLFPSWFVWSLTRSIQLQLSPCLSGSLSPTCIGSTCPPPYVLQNTWCRRDHVVALLVAGPQAHLLLSWSVDLFRPTPVIIL